MVITGAGSAFCAGAHLDDLLGAQNADELSAIYSGFLAFAHSSLPSVAAVNGAAVGAGMNLALASDLIIAGESARFDSRFHQIAIHSGGGHTWRLMNKTDLQTAKAMVLFGERLSGQQAAEAGLAWKCVPDAELLDAAIGYAATAAAAPKGLCRQDEGNLQPTQRCRRLPGRSRPRDDAPVLGHATARVQRVRRQPQSPHRRQEALEPARIGVGADGVEYVLRHGNPFR